MPVIRNENIEGKYKLGLWMVDEKYDHLFSFVNLNTNDCEKLNSFQNQARRIEWLSVRAMLKVLINCDTGIYYNERRKPFLCDHSMNISISHSHKLTSVLLSKNYRVGIDLEYMSHRIEKIKHKFMNDNEYITTNHNFQLYHMYIYWCAKEALYKICNKNELNFKTNLIIEPFEPDEAGTIKGSVIRDNLNEVFKMKYFKFDNYIVVWCLK